MANHSNGKNSLACPAMNEIFDEPRLGPIAPGLYPEPELLHSNAHNLMILRSFGRGYFTAELVEDSLTWQRSCHLSLRSGFPCHLIMDDDHFVNISEQRRMNPSHPYHSH